MPEDGITPGSMSIPTTPVNRGRGRPRKEEGAPKVTTTQNLSADVKKAVKTLDTMYSLIGMGLVAGGFIDTATAFVEATESLTKTNEANLNAAPKLARRIAALGETGGSAAFLGAHALALFPVVLIARKEVDAKIQDKAAKQDVSPTDLG